MYPEPIRNLIATFKKLPGVGNRTAERFVFQLLQSGKREVGEMSLALRNLTEKIKSCPVCWDFSDTSPCALCVSSKRDSGVICVVENSQDRESIEKIHLFQGRYHVLRGTVSPEDPLGESTKIAELLKRVETSAITEIILALNPSLPGETTMLFLETQIRERNRDIKITRLARGLPMGSDLEYADEITLESAFKHRVASGK